MPKVSTKGYLYRHNVPTRDADGGKEPDTKLYLFRPDGSSELVHLVPHLLSLRPDKRPGTPKVDEISIERFGLVNGCKRVMLSIEARGEIFFNRWSTHSPLCTNRGENLGACLLEGEYDFTLRFVS